MEYTHILGTDFGIVMENLTPNLSQDKSWFHLSMIWPFCVSIIKKLLIIPGISRNKGIDVVFVTFIGTVS